MPLYNYKNILADSVFKSAAERMFERLRIIKKENARKRALFNAIKNRSGMLACQADSFCIVMLLRSIIFLFNYPFQARVAWSGARVKNGIRVSCSTIV